MNKIKELPPVEDLRKEFVLDSSSPSGLRWNGKMGNKPAGCKADNHYIIYFKGKYYQAGRIVYLMAFDEQPGDLFIDHSDGNPSNNSPSNLRLVSHAQNMANRKTHKNNKFGVKGVQMYNGKNKTYYSAMITVDKKQIPLGQFSTAEEARQAFEDASKKYNGQYAKFTTQEELVKILEDFDFTFKPRLVPVKQECNFCPYFSFI